MFAAVLADRGRPLAICLSILRVYSIRLIQVAQRAFFQFLDGNSGMIPNAQ
jgi:hypothetical protein